jgi:MFS transporter, DHA1 family, inner membrane transport protein
MFSGLTIANLAGVPLGTLVGQVYGWRATFAGVTVPGVVFLAATAALIPSVAGGGAIDLVREFVGVRRPRILLALATTVLGWASVISLFTYIVPILEGSGGFTPQAVTMFLFVMGVGLTAGLNIGERLADRHVMCALMGLLALLAILSVSFARACSSQVAALASAFLWGMTAFATIAPMQARMLGTAKGAPNVASALNIGAFNLGNATGTLIVGAVLEFGLSLRAPFLAAAGAAALWGVRLDRAHNPAT